MSWKAIAKKDFQDSVRSRGLWGLIGLFFVLMFLLSVVASPSEASGTQAVVEAIGLSFIFGLIVFVPLSGLFISVKSIARERESGTINLLLSLPHSRFDMVLGKFIGRSVVMTITIIATFLPAILYLLSEVGFNGEALYAMFSILLAITLFGIVFVAVGIGLSALVNNETQASIAGVFIFFVLLLWIFIIDGLGISTPTFVDRFWLFVVFTDVVLTLIHLYEGDLGSPSAAVGGESGFGGEFAAEAATSVPIYHQEWFVVVVLALWLVIPLAIGYYRFNTRDL